MSTVKSQYTTYAVSLTTCLPASESHIRARLDIMRCLQREKEKQNRHIGVIWRQGI